MKEALYNNGYVVKSLYNNTRMYPPSRDNYRGIGRNDSWPLDDFDDRISTALNKEAWHKWFAYQRVFEVVPEKEYLQRYIRQCDDLGIRTRILMVESPLDTQLASDSLVKIETLGFDLMNSVNFSYLTMDTDYLEGECAIFNQTVSKLNANGLCDSIEDIREHLKLRNFLLSQGINLENSDWGPFPVRLSEVHLDYPSRSL